MKVSIAAALLVVGLSGSAFAQAAGTPPGNDPTPVTTPEMVNANKADDTGMKVIGIDITKAGADAAAIKAYNAGLAANAQERLKSNCLVVIANKAGANAKVLKFCQDLTGTM